MSLIQKNGRYSLNLRVPKRFQHLDPRSHARVALGTRDRPQAEIKAAMIREELWRYWEALEAGQDPGAQAIYENITRLAAARGVFYRPAQALAEGPLH